MPSTVAIDNFRGIDTLHGVLDIGPERAQIASNVAFDVAGQVRTRDGYTVLATTTTAPTTMHVYTTSAGATQFLTSSATKLEAFSSAGSGIATQAATGPHCFANAGTPGAPRAYTCSAGEATVRKWDGAAWGTVAGAPANATCVAWSPNSQRLVFAGHNSGDRVQFSDVAAPETFTATSWVDVQPGDGESITAMRVWQGNIFVFKQSKFFVFYSETIDSTGKPVFNYRTVYGLGAIPGFGSSTAVVAPEGVYFLAQDGLYLTNGGPPVLASGDVQATFYANGGFLGNFNSNCSLAYHYGRLFMSLMGTGGTIGLYVRFREQNDWATWTLMSGMAGGVMVGGDETGTTNPKLYWVDGTSSSIFVMTRGDTTDNGSAISFFYESGYYALGDGKRAVSGVVDVVGTGTATLTLLTTDSGPGRVADPGTALTLGVATPATARRSRAVSGRYHAHKFTGTGQATVTKLIHRVDAVENAS